MFLSKLSIENFRCFGDGDDTFILPFKLGLTALVGENDSGKSAVIDAIRFVLGTTDQEWYRLEDADFRPGEDNNFKEIKIVCKFEGLSVDDKKTFLEYLTYSETKGGEPAFYIHWTAKNTGEMLKGRPYRRVEIRSGKVGDGPKLAQKVRELLRATYLRPLRDAEQALSARRGSRLSQVLRYSKFVNEGNNSYVLDQKLKDQGLSILGIGKLINYLLESQKGIEGTRGEIDKHLKSLSLSGNDLKSQIRVGDTQNSDDILLLRLLEKLDLTLRGNGKLGLGSNNLLFISCELLLLAQDIEGTRLLLIEEPEAHLHAQRQLQVMKYMQKQTEENDIQIIVSTHSPNLASAIDLDKLVMIQGGRAFPMAENYTELEQGDYRFLQRFLDVTKANLFFARGVMIVEGDAENILLPTLARLIGRDFTEHGVSIVNVGGVGLRRYARIFQRKEGKKELGIPVACVTDMDVMPDCAPEIIGKKRKDDGNWPKLKDRQWRAKMDFDAENKLDDKRDKIIKKATGQCVQTFVSEEWTLEYDLALSELAKDVFVAASLAKTDDAINSGRRPKNDVIMAAIADFTSLEKSSVALGDCTAKEVLASKIYAKFAKGEASKSIAAQYLAERMIEKNKNGELSPGQLREWLPKYLVDAIEYVTGSYGSAELETNEEATNGS